MNPEYIRAELRLLFGSMAEFGRKLGVSAQAIPNTISNSGYSPRLEKEIAKALGKTPYQVFPTRYHKNGKRIDLRVSIK